MLRLDTLPVEILQHIALHLAPRSITILSHTSRKIRVCLAYIVTIPFALRHLEFACARHGILSGRSQNGSPASQKLISLRPATFPRPHLLATISMLEFTEDTVRALMPGVFDWLGYVQRPTRDLSDRIDMMMEAAKIGLFSRSQPEIEQAFLVAARLDSLDLLNALFSILSTFPCEEQTMITKTLFAAAHHDSTAVMASLISRYPALVNVRDGEDDGLGETLLHVAALRDNISALKLLLGAGAELDARDACGETAVHWAAREGRADAVAVLVASGGWRSIWEGRAATPLHLAAEGGFVDVLEILLNGVANLPTSFSDSSRKLCAEIIDVPCLPSLATPMHRAAKESQPQAVAFLISKGANPNVRDRHQRTPLHAAMRKLRSGWWCELDGDGDNSAAECVRILLENGADVNARDVNGHTPLEAAAPGVAMRGVGESVRRFVWRRIGDATRMGSTI
ncbi:hypothetical protein HDU96_008242 [Phlyctochytrium bullatum]|nr:hypothetical protein HDU96_008242 [Phlyctochytrium bullatum]